MKNVSPTQAASNWANGMANSSQKLTAGINAVTVSPTSLAAGRIDAMVAGIQRAAASGKIAAGLNAVSLQEWQQAMLTKGVPRVAAGAQAAKNKVQAFFTQFLPYLQQGVQALQATPRGDLETNIARAAAMMRHNAQFRYTR
jgi:hypothetical protein